MTLRPQNQGKVKLGEAAPIFRPIRAGDKVMRDGATENQGKVKLGEARPRSSVRSAPAIR